MGPQGTTTHLITVDDADEVRVRSHAKVEDSHEVVSLGPVVFSPL
jgi:hypothetical protein